MGVGMCGCLGTIICVLVFTAFFTGKIVGVGMCGCLGTIICVLVFTAFLYCFFYIYLFFYVLV